MQGTHPDAFALKNSGLDAFLYADVGAESNGSTLTILSVLARLGLDPWAQAANWAALPTAGAIDGLSQSIDQMPLTPAVLAESRVIAARLVQLLPGKPRPAAAAEAAAARPAATMPIWSRGTMMWCIVAAVIALTALVAPRLSTDVIAPLEPQTAIPGAVVPPDVPSPR